MATDSLQIFGTSYTGVTGIKATDSSNGTKTYIRPQGTKSITANGTGIDVTEYASVDVAVSGGGSPTLQAKTNINPTTSSQTITADNGYDGLSSVQINAMPTGIAAITAIKGTVSNHSVQITPNANVTQAGYFTSDNYSGTAITVAASELVSGTKSITANGIGIDVTNYASVDVSITGPTQYYSAYLTTSNFCTLTYDNTTYNSLGDNFVFEAGDTVTVRLTARTACYIYQDNVLKASNTQGGVAETDLTLPASNVTIAVTQVNSTTNRVDVNSTSATSVTLSANGTYAVAGYNSAVVNVSSGSPNLQAKTNISPTTSSQTITADSGYDGLSSVQINAMPSGSASGPSTVSSTSATVSTGTNTLTLTKTVSITPTVSAGYVSAGTATNATVTLTGSVTTKAAATITPGTTNQTIASGTYLTGTQTISGDANLVAGNIKSGTTIFGITGSYTGSGDSSKNIQYKMGRYEVSATSYTATSLSITVSKAGSYKCYWVMDRNTTSGTTGSQLYKNNSAVGSAHTSWTYNNNNRNGMNCEETLTLAVDDVLVVRARSRSTSYICGVSNLIIVEQ